MQKVAIITMSSFKEELLELLHNEGILDVADLQESTKIDHSEVRFHEAELEFTIHALTPFAPKEVLAASKKPTTPEEVERIVLHTDMRGIIDTVHALEKTYQQAKKEMTHVQNSSPETTGGGAGAEAAYVTGSAPKRRQHLGGAGMASAVQNTAEEEEKKHVRIQELNKTIEECEKEKERLSQELPALMLARQFLKWLDQKQSVRESLHETSQTVTLFGWVPKKQLSTLESTLASLSPATALLKIKPDPDEEAPVMMGNSAALLPFESVTELYGLPRASEIDPTPILAPFFIIFFGLCLTDAGYGLVLALVMGAYLWKTKKTMKEAKIWWLLMIGGIVTFFISIPFGGWFGLLPHEAPSFMTETRADGLLWFKGQIWNLGETKGINFFQNLSLGLGLIHLSLGIFLGGYSKWRLGERVAAFWYDWTALILFTTVGIYFLVPESSQPMALYAIYFAAALTIWGKGYGNRWFLRPLFGLLGLVNLAMSMLSNTLSYLRLLALGLVTGALALAVNLVASQISEILPTLLGIPVKITILLLGHLMNIALNTLGAFIHSGRLQFVEFFGQFFEGGGKPFSPFQKSFIIS